MQVLKSKKRWVSDFESAKTMVGDLEVLMEFHELGEVADEGVMEKFSTTKEIIENLEFKNMLSEEGDELTAVLQITAGAGGTESCDWAAMLMRMYMMWAEKNGYKVKELNYQDGDVAGIKTVTLEIEG